MENYFGDISEPDKKIIIMAPVYAALLGALEHGKIRHRDEKVAMDLAHFKTFTSAPILQEYYKEVEQSFSENLKNLESMLPEEFDKSREFLQKELQKVYPVLEKMNHDFACELSKSLQFFTKQVAETKGVLEEWLHYFVFPVNLEG